MSRTFLIGQSWLAPALFHLSHLDSASQRSISVYICRLLPLVLRHVRLRPFTSLFFCPFRLHLPCFSSAHLPPPIHLQNQTELRSRLLSLSIALLLLAHPFCTLAKCLSFLPIYISAQLVSFPPQLSTDALVTNSLSFVALKSEHCAR